MFQGTKYLLRKPSFNNDNYFYLSNFSNGNYKFYASSPLKSIPLSQDICKLYKEDIGDENVEIVKVNLKMTLSEK